jgi:hypothetical protein
VSLNDLDKELEQFKTRTRFATENLIELSELFTYKRLRGEDGLPAPRLTGVSQKKVEAALTAIDRIWEHLNVLNTAIDRATAFRKSMWLTTDSNVREFEQLVRGPAIQLSSISTPLAGRSLLGPAETTQSISIGALQTRMTRDFEQAKSVVLAVQAAWDEMAPAIAAAADEAASLQVLAQQLGSDGTDVLREAGKTISALNAQTESDPLQVSSTMVNEIQPLLQRTRSKLNELARERKQIRTELLNAQTLLHEIDQLHEQCRIAYSESTLKIADPQGLIPPTPDAKLRDLKLWLQTLASKSQSEPKSMRVALGRWMESANACAGDERKVLQANQAPLDARAELRGRFDALKVKAQARAAQDAELEKAAAETHKALKERPMRLDVAAKLVHAYELALADSIKKKNV